MHNTRRLGGCMQSDWDAGPPPMRHKFVVVPWPFCFSGLRLALRASAMNSFCFRRLGEVSVPRRLLRVGNGQCCASLAREIRARASKTMLLMSAHTGMLLLRPRVDALLESELSTCLRACDVNAEQVGQITVELCRSSATKEIGRHAQAAHVAYRYWVTPGDVPTQAGGLHYSTPSPTSGKARLRQRCAICGSGPRRASHALGLGGTEGLELGPAASRMKSGTPSLAPHPRQRERLVRGSTRPGPRRGRGGGGRPTPRTMPLGKVA